MRKPPYRIFTNLTVNQLALRRPVTLEELLEVPGLGKRRALRYQVDLLGATRHHRHSAWPPASRRTSIIAT